MLVGKIPKSRQPHHQISPIFPQFFWGSDHKNHQILRTSSRLHGIGQVRPVQEFLPRRDTVAAFDEDAKEAKTWSELSEAWDSPMGGQPGHRWMYGNSKKRIDKWDPGHVYKMYLNMIRAGKTFLSFWGRLRSIVGSYTRSLEHRHQSTGIEPQANALNDEHVECRDLVVDG